MANREIGESELVVGGVAYLMRPSFKCLAEIEDRVGMGLMKMAYLITDSNMTVKHVVAILWGGIYGAMNGKKMPFTFDQFADLIQANGYSNFVAPAITFLNGAMVGGQVEEKKILPQAVEPPQAL